MRREAENRPGRQEPADLTRRQVVLADVHAVGAEHAGHVGPVVHDEEHPGLTRGGRGLGGQREEPAVRETLGPELHDPDAARGDGGHRRPHRPAAEQPHVEDRIQEGAGRQGERQLRIRRRRPSSAAGTGP